MTTRTYFPGANTGNGFFNSFSGIRPAWEAPHYIYILKGGPGVGKNTLMKRVLCTARANGLEAEEFRCASDPDSLDAIRIPQRRVILLDGTDPHMLDPRLPGIEAEIVNLGFFRHRESLAYRRHEVERLMAENRAHYDAAYACLAAAAALRRAACSAAARVTDGAALRDFLQSSFDFPKTGDTPRRLFIASATPKGVVDFSETLCASRTVCVSGAVGALLLREAMRLAEGTCSEIFLDFKTPETAQGMLLPDGTALFLTDDGDAHGALLKAPLPPFVPAALREADVLTAQSTQSLRLCLEVHDALEALYRPFVDYARVDMETERLLERLHL